MSDGHRKREAVFAPKMGYKGSNMFKELEVVNQVTDTFRYPQMKKSDPEPVFPRQRWCYFCPYRKIPEGPGRSDVILHLAKKCVREKSWPNPGTDQPADRTITTTVCWVRNAGTLTLCVVCFSRWGLVCWLLEGWRFLTVPPLSSPSWELMAIQLVNKFLGFYCARNLIALHTKARH